MEKPVASGRTAYTVIGLVFALLVGGYFVYQISAVVLAFLLTILLSIILSAPVNYLARRGWPRTWGVLTVVTALVAVLWLFGLALVPAVETQSRQFAEAFPTQSDPVADRFAHTTHAHRLPVPDWPCSPLSRTERGGSQR